MSRGLTPDAEAAVGEQVVRPFLAAELDFLSAPVYVNSSPIDLMVNGHLSRGIGSLGSIGGIEETSELKAYQLRLRLTGVQATYISATLNEQYQGRQALVFIGFLNEQHVTINDPIMLFRGRMDTIDVKLDKMAELTLTCESRLADWERPRIGRYTDADQQKRYPGDLGLQFISQMVEKELVWGRS